MCHKTLCRYFHAAQKKAVKNSPKNKDDISLAIANVLKKSSSTRASLSAIKNMNPSVSEAQAKKKKVALAKNEKKAREAEAKKKRRRMRPKRQRKR